MVSFLVKHQNMLGNIPETEILLMEIGNTLLSILKLCSQPIEKEACPCLLKQYSKKDEQTQLENILGFPLYFLNSLQILLPCL